MITLQVCSKDPNFNSKIGTFSQNMNMILDQFTKEEEKVETRANVMNKTKAKSIEESISEKIEDEQLNFTNIEAFSYIKVYLKWFKKIVANNYLSLTFHVSLILFFRELSRKMLK
jgi:hypothetical protein